jgi:glycosyltransferase involved in cell wall biosynthesis
MVLSAPGPDSGSPSRWAGQVVQLLATSTGGVGSHVLDLTRGLVAGGAEVTVCGPAATEERFDFTGAGARFRPVEISAGTQPSDARSVGALRRAVASADPQVVHAHGLRAGLVASLARSGGRGGRDLTGGSPDRLVAGLHPPPTEPRRGGLARGRAGPPPLVVTLHNAVISRGVRGSAARVVERIVARNADVILGASADLVARARAVGAADARLAPVAAPPLPPPRRTPAAVRAELRVGSGTALVLSVGRLHPQKGYDVLVAAAARWRELAPPARVAIAGTGPSYLDLTARISTTRAPVTLLGHRDDVADLLAAADLAVVSSVWEARQLFAQEAMRAGVPLVATAVGGVPELVGEAAVLVPPGEVDALDRAVRELLASPAERARYARAALAQAATWPTSAETLAQVQQVYAELSPTAGGGAARASAADQ